MAEPGNPNRNPASTGRLPDHRFRRTRPGQGRSQIAGFRPTHRHRHSRGRSGHSPGGTLRARQIQRREGGLGSCCRRCRRSIAGCGVPGNFALRCLRDGRFAGRGITLFGGRIFVPGRDPHHVRRGRIQAAQGDQVGRSRRSRHLRHVAGFHGGDNFRLRGGQMAAGLRAQPHLRAVRLVQAGIGRGAPGRFVQRSDPQFQARTIRPSTTTAVAQR